MKYGFVYIWYDRKRKMFYIGCHWGAEDDGYLCSSNRMRDAHSRRPQDFRRRIISRIYTNRQDLLNEEHKWFQMIKPEELGKRYYNLRQHKWGHWSSDIATRKTVSEKLKESWSPEVRRTLSEKNKELWTLDARKKHGEIQKLCLSKPETREKLRYSKLGNKHRLGKKHSEETKEKMRISMLGKNLGKQAWNKGKRSSEETKKRMSESAKNSWNIRKNNHLGD